MKKFLKSYFRYIATFGIGLILAIWGQIKFDYAKTDAGYKWGEVIGWTGITIAVVSLVIVFANLWGGNKSE